jgi:hypothetical protein
MTSPGLLLHVRNLLQRIDERLAHVDVDETIRPEQLDADRLAEMGDLVRRAAALLDGRDDPAAIEEIVGRASPFVVGDRFWSVGLQAPCRVLALNARALEFVSESTTDANIRTDVPLELVRRHVANGRWQPLPPRSNATP